MITNDDASQVIYVEVMSSFSFSLSHQQLHESKQHAVLNYKSWYNGDTPIAMWYPMVFQQKK